MIIYTWTIESADCIISQNGLNNIIQTVYWRYLGQDEKDTVFELSGSYDFPSPNIQEFKPFDEINSSIVIKWLENYMDISQLQLDIENKINELNNPVITRMQIPN